MAPADLAIAEPLHCAVCGSRLLELRHYDGPGKLIRHIGWCANSGCNEHGIMKGMQSSLDEVNAPLKESTAGD